MSLGFACWLLCSECLTSHFSLTRFMNTPLFSRSSSSIIIRLIFNFCIPVGTLLYFCSLVSNYFSSPSFFCKVACSAYQILSCFSFIWKFTILSVLYLLHEVLSFYHSSRFIHTFRLFFTFGNSLWFAVVFCTAYTTVILATRHSDVVWIDYFDPYLP